MKKFFHTLKNKNEIITLIHKAFITCFMILLFIPMMNISHKDISETEKRTLTKLPSLFINQHLNKNFTAQFESWFNDRFNTRELLILLHSKFKKTLDYNAHSSLVLRGKDNWLFYKGDHALDNFQNKTLFNETELKIIAKYLSDFDTWSRQNGKSFYYIIAPDKHKIYGEYITSLTKLHPDEKSRANQLITYLKRNTNVNVIYPYQTLIAHKDQGFLYYKHNTHWSDLGAYFAYQDIIQTIQMDYTQIIPVKSFKNKTVKHELGDLPPLINWAVEKDQTEYLEPEIIDQSSCISNLNNQNSIRSMHCHNSFGTLNVIIFHDSFTEGLQRYYNNTFTDVQYEWRWDILSKDLEYIKQNSDIIILETVERFIPSLLTSKFPEH